MGNKNYILKQALVEPIIMWQKNPPKLILTTCPVDQDKTHQRVRTLKGLLKYSHYFCLVLLVILLHIIYLEYT
jgi:hypothetical protein